MSAEYGTQGVIFQCLLRRARPLARSPTDNQRMVVGRKEEGERARARSARAPDRAEDWDGRDGPTRFLFFVIRKKGAGE